MTAWARHPADPPQLFNLDADPIERINLAGQHSVQSIETELRDAAQQQWDLTRLHADVLASQRRRRWIQQQRLAAGHAGWDYQPHVDASRRFVRSGGQSSPTMVKGLARFPYVEPKPPDDPREPGSG